MKKLLARAFLRWNGWRAEGQKPAPRRYVMIAAPHTSNWDMFYMLAIAVIFDVKISFMAKHTLFRWPFGGIMRRLGALPIRRHLRENVVEQMVATFGEEADLALTVPAEGTRGRVECWRSGFYQIAIGAGVPIVMGYLDYERKRGGFGPELTLTGVVSRDMDALRAFYGGMQGKHPENFGAIRLRDEAPHPPVEPRGPLPRIPAEAPAAPESPQAPTPR